MKAAIFHAYGKADVIDIVDIPAPSAGDDEIIVRVKAASINPKDIFIRKGYFKQFTGSTFPMQTGFDFAGEIVEVGNRIVDYQTKDAVFGMIGGWSGRACSEFISVKPNQISHQPGNLTYVEAAALPLVSLTALQALRDMGHIESGKRVCINGASGGVGSMAVQVAKRYNAIITAISSKSNHTMMKSLGADVCIDYHEIDIAHSQNRFNIFFDVFGNQFFEKVKPILASDGTWISTVIRPEVDAAVQQTLFSTEQKAKQIMVQPDANDLALIRQWVEAGEINPIIHSVYSLEQIKEAHKQQETKHTRGKLVIDLCT